MSFTKLSSTIVHSTVWREPHHVRIVWITMLALSDPNGYVGASVPGLADAARVTLAECEQALESFLGPDPYSRTSDHEGRRIEKVEGGWRLLNHALYRAGRDPEARRLQNREAQARRRERERTRTSVADVADVADADDNCLLQPESAHAESESESESESEADPDPPLIPPPGGKAKARAKKQAAIARPSDWQPTKAHQEYATKNGLDVELEADGFRGHHDAKGSVFVSWDAAFRTWLTNQVRWNRERGAGRRRVEVQRGVVDEATANSWGREAGAALVGGVE